MADYRYTAPDGTKYDIRWNGRRYQHEVTFESRPSREVLDNIKSAGGRWYRSGGFWVLNGHNYAGDDIPMVVNGDNQAGCHARCADEDEAMYQSAYGSAHSEPDYYDRY